ncbi:hypothetical protein MLD38_020632 [Melastoma candidum]|uniref:Uncharacterized protein n=1 Tax=Melastoma candidum TaxID=119954 RepID=A0ACB9QD37_9MYRT|nr:hypothetical protein MLD38_020632 [Melastoma candidum]
MKHHDAAGELAAKPSSASAASSSYQLLEEIGRGRFGTIHRCYSPAKNAFFACKVVDKSLLSDPTDRQCLNNEPTIMSFLPPHPHVLRIHDSYDSPGSLSLILDLCLPISLHDLIVSEERLPESRVRVFMVQLLGAVAHCHAYGVVHRDIKPENVLLVRGGRGVQEEAEEDGERDYSYDSSKIGEGFTPEEESEEYGVKLGDFGSAEWLGEGGMADGVVGTPHYVAPEVLRGRGYGEKVDVWSAGVVMYAMLAGFQPFRGERVEEVFDAVCRGNLRFPTRVFREVSGEAKDLLRKMVCRDVSRRLTAEQALRHPWIAANGGGQRLVN